MDCIGCGVAEGQTRLSDTFTHLKQGPRETDTRLCTADCRQDVVAAFTPKVSG